MPITRSPFTGNIFDQVAFDRWMRTWVIETDPGTVGTEEIVGGAAADDDKFYIKRAGELTFDVIADADIPSTIARDSEVAQAITDHEAEADPHPVYSTAAEATAIVDAAIVDHEAQANPHPTYLTQAEGDARYSRWLSVIKAADETISSDAVLGEDADLKFAMLANTKYSFRARIFFDTSAAADFKYRHSGPAAPTLVRVHRREVIAGGTADTTSTVDTAYSAADISLAGAGTDGGYIELDGIVHNGTNAGDFAFQWAQNTSDASNTTVRASSYIEWQ